MLPGWVPDWDTARFTPNPGTRAFQHLLQMDQGLPTQMLTRARPATRMNKARENVGYNVEVHGPPLTEAASPQLTAATP